MEFPPIICLLPEAAAPDLERIDAQSNRPPWSAGQFLQEFSQPHARVYGARRKGAVVAFLVCHCVLDEAHILNFAVAHAARGEGIGSFFLRGVLRRLSEDGVVQVTLEVRRSNTIARHLYSSLGFQEVGIREQYYSDDHEDALVLFLDLRAVDWTTFT